MSITALGYDLDKSQNCKNLVGILLQKNKHFYEKLDLIAVQKNSQNNTTAKRDQKKPKSLEQYINLFEGKHQLIVTL
jgi:hypothetical protein